MTLLHGSMCSPSWALCPWTAGGEVFVTEVNGFSVALESYKEPYKNPEYWGVMAGLSSGGVHMTQWRLSDTRLQVAQRSSDLHPEGWNMLRTHSTKHPHPQRYYSPQMDPRALMVEVAVATWSGYRWGTYKTTQVSSERNSPTWAH